MLETADLVLKNARILNVFTGAILEPSDLAIKGERIIGWGRYAGKEEVDLQEKIVIPGLIDGHVHLESSMVSPGQFARAVVPRGTTAVIADPHEIANVCGHAGIKYILDAAENLPLRVFLDVPSCVPATPMEDSGARLDADDVAQWMGHPKTVGLGEVMDVSAVLNEDADMLKKLQLAKEFGKVINGHAPGLSGQALMKYRSFGIGSDHECMLPEEAEEKLGLGFRLMLREGTATKNLVSLLPVVTAGTLPYCLLVTDDRHPTDLLREGQLDHLVRLAVESGLDPVSAVRMATINTAEYYGLKNLGAISPGYQADLVVLNDLENFIVDKVYCAGKLAADKGEALFEVTDVNSEAVQNTCNIAPLSVKDFKIRASGNSAKVMELVPHQVVTRKIIQKIAHSEGEFQIANEEDMAKLVVIERHRASGQIGKGIIKGFGIKEGAVASTIAHDAHNLVVIGINSKDMLLAAEKVSEIGGGLAVVRDGKVLGCLPLEIAGLMSTQNLEIVEGKLSDLAEKARSLGIKNYFDPFLTMAFLSLAVIPELKVTNRGLVDVSKARIVSVSENN